MSEAKQVCSLDYMVGTLATAYKGLVTSLVVKDFCVIEDDQSTLIEGRILSLPDGRYQIALLRGGIAVVREELSQGRFEIHAPIADIGAGADLQLDLVQEGRHIGTFLLKRESREGAYVSAFEIARDLKGIPFHALVESVRELEGIRRNGEEIVTIIFSSKKNWKDLSEKLLTFSSDIFWGAREAFYLWQPVFARFSLKAAFSVEDADRGRAVSNVLSIIELALERETDAGRLNSLITPWMNELRSQNVSLSAASRQALRVLRRMYDRIPDADISPFMLCFLSSIREAAAIIPFIHDPTSVILRRYLGEESISRLARFTPSYRDSLLEQVASIEKAVRSGAKPVDIVDAIGRLDLESFDAAGLIDTFFRVIHEGLAIIDDDGLAGISRELQDILDHIGEEQLTAATVSVRELPKSLLAGRRIRPCMVLLDVVGASRLRDDVLLNVDIAAHMLENDDPLLGIYE